MATDPFVSVDAAIAADDLDRAADLVERLAEGFVAGTQPRSPTLRQLETLLGKLAPVAGRRPWLLYYAAWVASALRQQRLVELCQELGMLDEAIRQAEELVLHDPAAELGYRLLIRAHLARDDRSTALSVLHRCQAQMAEYGGPSPGLLALL
jgi:ATP/maltotriose-dependent transcriptional regulator MalT